MSRPRLSRAKIVATAIRMADENGIGAVTLRGIGTRLGVHVTSLYNHVPTKEAVVDEMVKALIAEAKLPTGTVDWRDWVRAFTAAMRTLAAKHPGAFEAFQHAPAQGARAAETFESAFAAFRAAGFDAAGTYCSVKTTIVAAIGLALDDSARARKPGLRTDLAELPVENFPTVHEVAPVTETTDTFDYLVDTLIAGFEAQRLARAEGGY